MCGRFDLHAKLIRIQQKYNATNVAEFAERYNIAPQSAIPVVLRSRKTNEIEMHLMRWGLIPSWAKDAKIGNNMINARGETVDTKPGYRDAFKERRCIIPADGFYEWNKQTKEPYYFLPSEKGEVFSFAGLWDRWKSPDGSIITSCAIITTAANDLVTPIHERMPVILGDNAIPVWLAENATPGELKPLLGPAPAGMMTARRVSTMVNNPRNDSPQLIEAC